MKKLFIPVLTCLRLALLWGCAAPAAAPATAAPTATAAPAPDPPQAPAPAPSPGPVSRDPQYNAPARRPGLYACPRPSYTYI